MKKLSIDSLFRLLSVGCLAAAGIFAAATDSSPNGTAEEPGGELRGLVVSATSEEVLKGVVVSLRLLTSSEADEGPVITTVTGLDGQFGFSNLPKGDYELAFSKSGYQAPRDSRQLVTVRENTSHKNVLVRLRRSVVIAGRIVNGEGEPLSGARVVAYRLRHRAQKPFLQPRGSKVSNDLGEYRIFDLPEGKYVVGASVMSPELPRGVLTLEHGATFYPGTAEPSQAMPMNLRWGGEATGIDLELRSVPATVVSGTVFDATTGTACASCSIRFARQESDFTFPIPYLLRTADSGVFVARGLEPGSYLLTASTSGFKPRIGSQSLQLSEGSVQEVVLSVTNGVSISGTIDWNDSTSTHKQTELGSSDVRVQLHPQSGNVGGMVSATVRRGEESFALEGIPPGAYRVELTSLPAAAYLKSVSLGGCKLAAPTIVVSDMPVTGLELGVSFDAATLQGRVSAAESGPPKMLQRGTIVLVPLGRSSGYAKTVQGHYGPDGAFVIGSLPPGSYYAFAAATRDPAKLGDPDIQGALSKFRQTVILGPGKEKVLQLTVKDQLIGIN